MKNPWCSNHIRDFARVYLRDFSFLVSFDLGKGMNRKETF